MMDKLKEPTPSTSSGQGNGHLTTLEAKKLLENEALERVKLCQAELEQILNKHNCTLDVMVILKAGQVIPQVQIISK